jgi:Mg-chelatase subunit ChlD
MWIPRVLLCYFAIALANVACADDQPGCAVHVSVIDKNSRPLTGLNAGDFRGTIKGRPVNIVSASVQQNAARLVMVIDESGSMDSNHPQIRDDGKRAMAREIVLKIVANAPATTQVGLLAFRGKKIASVPLKAAAEVLQNDALLPVLSMSNREGGPTLLWDNLYRALTTLQPPRPGDVVIAVTDGGDNASKISASQIQREFLAGGVRLFAVLLVSPSRVTPEDVVGPSVLADLAHATGGIALNATPACSIGRFAESPRGDILDLRPSDLVELALHGYRLEVDTSGLVREEKWKLEVIDTAGRKAKTTVFYPRQLRPCHVPSPASN